MSVIDLKLVRTSSKCIPSNLLPLLVMDEYFKPTIDTKNVLIFFFAVKNYRFLSIGRKYGFSQSSMKFCQN